MTQQLTIPVAEESKLASFAARDEGKVAALAEVLQAEARSPGGISAFDLTRIKLPAGGAQFWEVPSAEGTSPEKAFEAIILDWRDTRTYWEKPLEGGGQPPDCSSEDAERGSGRYGVGSNENPSGSCARCPMSQWGSGKSGGQACRAIRQLFLLRGSELLPTLLFLPPGSQKPFKKYTLSLASKGVRHYGAITSFGLAGATAKGGQAYSQVAPSLVSTIPSEEMEWVTNYRDALLPALRNAARIDQETGEIFDDDAAPWVDR